MTKQRVSRRTPPRARRRWTRTSAWISRSSRATGWAAGGARRRLRASARRARLPSPPDAFCVSRKRKKRRTTTRSTRRRRGRHPPRRKRGGFWRTATRSGFPGKSPRASPRSSRRRRFVGGFLFSERANATFAARRPRRSARTPSPPRAKRERAFLSRARRRTRPSVRIVGSSRRGRTKRGRRSPSRRARRMLFPSPPPRPTDSRNSPTGSSVGRARSPRRRPPPRATSCDEKRREKKKSVKRRVSRERL